jgi:hypothetical protein
MSTLTPEQVRAAQARLIASGVVRCLWRGQELDAASYLALTPAEPLEWHVPELDLSGVMHGRRAGSNRLKP